MNKSIEMKAIFTGEDLNTNDAWTRCYAGKSMDTTDAKDLGDDAV